MGYKHSREEMLEAAVEVSLESGIGALTFKRVATVLGIPDRMVVYYFPSKDDLVTAVALALGGQLQAILESAFGDETLPVDQLLRRAWPVLASRRCDPVFAVYFEMIGLASAGTAPYVTLAPALVDGWVAWLEPRVAAPTAAARRRQSLAAVAQLDGLLLLRRLRGSRAANLAARELGVLPG